MQDEAEGTQCSNRKGSLHTQYNRIADINHLIDPALQILLTPMYCWKVITIHLGIGHCLIQD